VCWVSGPGCTTWFFFLRHSWSSGDLAEHHFGLRRERNRGMGFRVPGSGFRVPSSGFRVPGTRFRVSGFGIQVSGSGFGFCETWFFLRYSASDLLWRILFSTRSVGASDAMKYLPDKTNNWKHLGNEIYYTERSLLVILN